MTRNSGLINLIVSLNRNDIVGTFPFVTSGMASLGMAKLVQQSAGTIIGGPSSGLDMIALILQVLPPVLTVPSNTKVTRIWKQQTLRMRKKIFVGRPLTWHVVF